MHSVADLFARYLVEAGINTVYGLPGGATLPILAALKRQGLQFGLVRNESSAVYMAGVTARLTGRPGVCLVTLGPGAANAMAGVAHAWLDRTPLLIVSADFPETVKGHHTHQVLDLAALFRPVSKASLRLEPAEAAAQIRVALDLAQSDRPGPVHLSLSGAVADQACDQTVIRSSLRIENPTLTNNLQKAGDILKAAQRPAIVVGLGLEPEQPYAELRELAEALGAPVIDTPKSKGALPAAHPLFGGTIGLMQTDPPYQLLDEADCLIAVGFDAVELVRTWDYTVPLIWIANWPNEDPVLPAAVSFVGLIKPILRQLIDTETRPAPAWGAARVARFRQGLRARTLPAPATGRLQPQAFLTALHEAMPATTALATDVGSHKILAALEWPAQTANRYFVSNGLSAMGYGLPAALAAALILGEQTVCLTGDAGFSMVIGELSLIQEHDLDVVVIIMNDAALDLIRAKQLRRNEPIFGTEFHNPDFAAIAKGYDLPFYQIDGPASARTALAEIFTAGGSALVEVLVDPASYPTAPAQSGRP